MLTAEERSLLVENTERLIERFEAEHQAEIAAAEKRRSLSESHLQFRTSTPTPLQPQFALRQAAPAPPLISTRAQRAVAEAQARRALEERFPGVDLDLPGFKGLVQMEVERLLRAKALSQVTLSK